MAPAEPSGKREDRGREIVAAAQAEFVGKGYAATRLDDVARRAGVAKGTLYLYFPSKAELFQAVVRAAIVSRVAEGEAAAAGGLAEAALRRALHGFAAQITAPGTREVVHLVIAESARYPEIADFYYAEVVQRGLAIIRGLVERGVAAGEFRPTALDRFPQALMAPVVMSLIWKVIFDRHSELDVEGLVETHLDLVLNGLKVAA